MSSSMLGNFNINLISLILNGGVFIKVDFHPSYWVLEMTAFARRKQDIYK